MSARPSTRDLLDTLHRNWPEVASPESDTVLALFRLAALAHAGVDSLLAEHELTPAAFEVLVTLRSAPPPRRLTPTELYRANLLSSGGLTKILNALSGRGLVALATNKADGRSKTVSLTPRGKRLVEAVAQGVAARDRALFAEGADAAGVARLRNGLLAVLDALERSAAAPAGLPVSEREARP